MQNQGEDSRLQVQAQYLYLSTHPTVTDAQYQKGYRFWMGSLDLILEQKEGICGKTSKIQIRPRV